MINKGPRNLTRLQFLLIYSYADLANMFETRRVSFTSEIIAFRVQT